MNAPERMYALITGAAGGIGRALVKRFTDAGYDVIATDRIDAPADLDCSSYIQTDLASLALDAQYAESVFTSIRSHLTTGKLHALVNNAAIQILGSTNELRREDWHLSLNVNLLAPFILTQGLLPELEAAEGSVLNISSVHASLTKKGFSAYATSKAGLSGMTRALAVDLAGRVRVNAIEPAAIRTEMLEAGFATNPAGLVGLEEHHPSRRLGAPGEVAALAVAISSGEFRFLNGSCIGLDGGIRGRLHDPA